MRLFSLSEVSIQPRTSSLKFARSPCTDPPGALNPARPLKDFFCSRKYANEVEPGGSVHGERANFRELVRGCIDTSDSEKRRIFQHFSRPTRFALFCTAPNLEIQLKMLRFSQEFLRNLLFSSQFHRFLNRFSS